MIILTFHTENAYRKSKIRFDLQKKKKNIYNRKKMSIFAKIIIDIGEVCPTSLPS